MVNLRTYAEGKPCLIRIPGVCNFDPKTTVLAHFRHEGISGLGLKPPDLIASWACFDCHAYVDTHHDEVTQLYFAHGVMRTLARLIEKGIIQIGSAADY